MSTQSILERNKDSLLVEYEDKLLQYADDAFAWDKFMVGCEVDKDRIAHAMNFHNLLCTDNCEMAQFIKNKIEDKLGCKKETLCDAIDEYKHHHHKHHNHTHEFECTGSCGIKETCDISNIVTANW